MLHPTRPTKQSSLLVGPVELAEGRAAKGVGQGCRSDSAQKDSYAWWATRG